MICRLIKPDEPTGSRVRRRIVAGRRDAAAALFSGPVSVNVLPALSRCIRFASLEPEYLGLLLSTTQRILRIPAC